MTYTSQIIPIFLLSTMSFVVAMAITPLLSHLLYRFKVAKRLRTTGMGSTEGTPVFTGLHHGKAGTPTMGGLLIWVTVALLTFLFNFSRAETYLPLFTLITVGLIGAADDLFNVRGIGGAGGGLRERHKLILQILIGLLGAYWFYFKLHFSIIHVPAVGDFDIGFGYIPLIVLVIVATTNAVNITDGLDGLAGGLLAIAFGAFGALSFANEFFALAAFCACIVGALLAFLWFNIYPARFFMGDTGSMALGATLGVVAALNDALFILPIIGIVFVAETLSVIIQLTWRKLFKRKLFRSAPIHHHFEALGWPETKVTMRFWIIGAVFAVLGLVMGIIGRGS